MWRVTVSLVTIIIICLLVQAKAKQEISLEDLLERLETLEEWKRETEHEVSALRVTVALQGTTIKNLERELAIQATITTTLQACQQETPQNMHELQAAPQDSVNDGKVSNNMIRSTDNQIPVQPSTMSKRAIASNVAFTAYLDHDVDLGTKQTIKFNQIITNEGNGYTTHTGVFTCPQAGLYLFSFFISERSQTGGNEIWAELMVNSQRVVTAMVETAHPSQDLQGGNTVVVRLNQGDSVWIDSYLASERHLEGNGLRATTFTGVYLHE